MDQKPGRVISFSAALKPSAAFQVVQPAERTDTTREPLSEQESPLARGTRGGLMIMRIMSMSEEEKRRVAGDAAAEDNGVVWWSMLTKAERAEIINAAEHDLKERFGT